MAKTFEQVLYLDLNKVSIYTPVLIVKEGFIEVWDKPGLGVEFKVEAASKYLPEGDEDFFD